MPAELECLHEVTDDELIPREVTMVLYIFQAKFIYEAKDNRQRVTPKRSVAFTEEHDKGIKEQTQFKLYVRR